VESEAANPPSSRAIVALAAAFGVAWQLLVVALAFRHAPILRDFLRDAGVQPPMLTRLFLASYQWWPLAPLLSALLAFVSAARRPRSVTAAGATALLPLLVGLVLQAWANEAAIAPLYHLIRTIH